MAKLVASPTLHATPMPESPSGERSGSVNTYRVVHAPSVAIRAGPWGKKLGIKQCGALVHCDASRDGWVRLQGGLDGEEAWMLIHGAKMGLGVLLQQESKAGSRQVSRWQVVASPHVHVRAAPRGRVLAQLACGEDCIVAVGLCGRLRAWHRESPSAAPPGDGGVSLTLSPASATSVVLALSWAPPPAADTGGWKLVLDENSRYELANHRFSSHAYRFLSEISADGRFAVGTTEASGQVQIWCTRTWKRLFTGLALRVLVWRWSYLPL